MKLKKLHFTIFRTCAFVTDWSIASYQEIFYSIPVEDKLATPAILYRNQINFFPELRKTSKVRHKFHQIAMLTTTDQS